MPKEERRRPLSRAARKAAASLALLALFVVGGVLGSAYVASAQIAPSDSTTTDEATTTAETTTTEPTPTQTTEPPAPPAPPAPPEPAPPQQDYSTPAADPAPHDSHHPSAGGTGHAHQGPLRHAGGYPTLWVNRTLADPTPPTKRLSPAFARQLRTISRHSGVRWSLLLAVVRARGGKGAVPMRKAELQHLAHRLTALHARKHARTAVAALPRTDQRFTDRVLALDAYNRAVGLSALVRGLQWAKPTLERKILGDRRIDLYSGGWADIASGRVNVRVSVLVRYLAIRYRQVTVSSLISGHGFFARPGVVSAHMYGLAADISALGGVSLIGHQEPGGLVEDAVAKILLLPAEVQPEQVISLLGLGGPSFPLSDHYDHIHVGF